MEQEKGPDIPQKTPEPDVWGTGSLLELSPVRARVILDMNPQDAGNETEEPSHK